MADVTIPITRPTSTTQHVNASTIKHDVKYPTELVDLPSKGYFYNNEDPLSKGSVELKMMTAKEEDILTSENLIKKGIVLDKLLESLVIDKTIDVSNFLTGDKNALFIAARRLAYGDNYGPIQIKCRKCGQDNETVINLGEIKTKPYNFSDKQRGVNVFDFILPYAKRTIQIKLLSNKDELEIDNELKALAKISKNSSEITTRLKYLIVSVDGNTDKAFVRKFVDNELLSRDSIELRKFIREITPDVDMNFDFTCTHCQSEERVGVPMTVQFFWPESGI
jgi:hypothetical protein